jgi:hypothetical protein
MRHHADNEVLEAVTLGENVIGEPDALTQGNDVKLIGEEVQVDVGLAADLIEGRSGGGGLVGCSEGGCALR